MTSNLHSTLRVALLSICVAAAAGAQSNDEATMIRVPGANPGVPVVQGVPPLEGLLFVGTAGNPSGTLNDAFTIDTMTDVSASVLSGVPVWGATADLANERVLFTTPGGGTSGGDELMAIPFAGGTVVDLGQITQAAAPQRIDGLAMSGGVLFAVEAGGGATNGFYTIDQNTLVATPVTLWADSISGLDADPDSGIIYGTNDTTGQLQTIASDGSRLDVTPYPAGITDIDGVAVGNGFVYLVTDEAQPISVWDIANGVYTTSLTSPFAAADVFSAAAFPVVAGPPPVPVIEVPALSPLGLTLLVGALLGLSWFVIARRRERAHS